MVRTSLTSSAPLRSSQISRLGPERQEVHVRGRPWWSRPRVGGAGKAGGVPGGSG